MIFFLISYQQINFEVALFTDTNMHRKDLVLYLTPSVECSVHQYPSRSVFLMQLYPCCIMMLDDLLLSACIAVWFSSLWTFELPVSLICRDLRRFFHFQHDILFVFKPLCFPMPPRSAFGTLPLIFNAQSVCLHQVQGAHLMRKQFELQNAISPLFFSPSLPPSLFPSLCPPSFPLLSSPQAARPFRQTC